MKKTRISLPPEERKEEILNTAERLFNEKGYNNVTVTDIINEIDVVKGTFYHYFKNKEEVKNILIDRYLDKEIKNMTTILNNKALTTIDKIKEMVYEIISLMHREETLMHDVKNLDGEIFIKIICERIERFKPLIRQVLDEGIKNKIFKPIYEEETLVLLLMNLAVTIPFFFYTQPLWSETHENEVIKTMTHNLELSLGITRGTFDDISDNWKNYV